MTEINQLIEAYNKINNFDELEHELLKQSPQTILEICYKGGPRLQLFLSYNKFRKFWIKVCAKNNILISPEDNPIEIIKLGYEKNHSSILSSLSSWMILKKSAKQILKQKNLLLFPLINVIIVSALISLWVFCLKQHIPQALCNTVIILSFIILALIITCNNAAFSYYMILSYRNEKPSISSSYKRVIERFTGLFAWSMINISMGGFLFLLSSIEITIDLISEFFWFFLTSFTLPVLMDRKESFLECIGYSLALFPKGFRRVFQNNTIVVYILIFLLSVFILLTMETAEHFASLPNLQSIILSEAMTAVILIYLLANTFSVLINTMIYCYLNSEALYKSSCNEKLGIA